MTLFLDTLKGGINTPPPIWMMRQAGRYLPEYRLLRKQKASFLEFCYHSDLAAQATLQPIERYDLDAAIIFSDILIIPDAMGAKVSFQEDIGPVIEKINNSRAIENLTLSRIEEHLSPLFEAIKKSRRALAPNKALIGFCGAAWTIACYMVSGRNVNNFYDTRKMACTQPELFQKLIDRISDAVIICLKAQIEAGIDAIQIFDSWSGLLPPDDFYQFSIKPTAKIVKNIRKTYPDIPIIGFPRGAGDKMSDYAKKTGITALQCDETQNMRYLVEKIPDMVFQGNLDPLLLLSTEQKIARNVLSIIHQMRDTAFIFNLGHGISKETDPKKVQFMIDVIREK